MLLRLDGAFWDQAEVEVGRALNPGQDTSPVPPGKGLRRAKKSRADLAMRGNVA